MYESEDTSMMWGYSLNGMNATSMILMVLGSTLWIVFLIVLAWMVIRWLNHRMIGLNRQTMLLPASAPTASEILSQRYARGEIDATTFGQMRERLEASDNAYPRSRAERQRPVGERLFDGGRTHDSEIM
jgi:uncharacterized membrane protein